MQYQAGNKRHRKDIVEGKQQKIVNLKPTPCGSCLSMWVMGISWDSWHSKTGGQRKSYHQKQKFGWGCPAVLRLGPAPQHSLSLGRQQEWLRLKVGCGELLLGLQALYVQSRVTDLVYNASIHGLPLQIPAKNCIMLLDSTPPQPWKSPWAARRPTWLLRRKRF